MDKNKDIKNDDADKNVCQNCGNTFKRLDKHEPSCKLKSAKVENSFAKASYSLYSDNGEEERKRNNVCSYCGNTFKRLDLHAPSCKLKSAKVENSFAEASYSLDSDNGEEERKRNNVCSYCGFTFKRLDLHAPSCKLKSAKVENSFAEASYSLDSDNGEGERKRNNVCSYCGFTFKRLDLHAPSCKLKSAKVERNFAEASYSSDSNNGEEERKRNNVCSYCGNTFKRLDLHAPSCKLKSAKVENSFAKASYSLDSDNGEGERKRNNVCSYCGFTFKRLDLHAPSCKLKSAKVERNFAEASYSLDSDNGEEERKRNNVCSYCGFTFKRLDLHAPSCKLKSTKVENSFAEASYSLDPDNEEEEERKRNNVCSYCGFTFKRLDLHAPSCKLKSAKVENSFAETSYSLDSNNGEEERKRNNVCSYCGFTFKRLDLHAPSCKLKSAKVEKNFAEAKYEPEFANEREEIKRNNVCSYCGNTFKRLDLHEPSCKLKSKMVENELDFENHNLDFQESKFLLKPEKLDPLLSEASEEYLTFNEFCKSVQLKRVDISCAKEVINDLMDNILKELKSSLPLKWQMFNSGSYYSHVKVLKPNEFDYMLCPTIVQCRIEPYAEDLCFCRVFVTNKNDLPYHFRNILTAENELKPSEFKKFTFPVFQELANKNRRLMIIENKVTCPAFTVKYEYTIYGRKEADVDWVPSLLVQNVPKIYTEWESKMISIQDKNEGSIFVVPKMKIVDGEEVEVWRLSYSFFEKEMIGSGCTTDERTIIRILKKIREEIKDENSALCSYHIVTSCLHFFHKTKERPKLQEYTVKVVDSLIGQLAERKLPHFFVKPFDLLADVEESECQRFIQRLNSYKQKWTK